MKQQSMMRTLLELRGNPKACVLTEPLWGIPHSLYMPFVSVYMLALGANDIQVGLVASLTLLFRTCTAALSGAITDKLGRKRATLIFDLLSWSLPCLLWTFSQNIWWFYFAAVFNGLWQVTENSWTCLLVEDAEKDKMVNIYSWIYLSGQLSVFFAPLSGLLVGNMSIIPAMRILYAFSFISMTAKFIILYVYCDETKVGKQRLKDTKGMSIFSVLAEYKELIPRFFRSGDMVMAMSISVLFTAITMIMQDFFGIYATKELMAPERYLAFFPIIRSAIMLVFIFLIQPRIARFGFKGPMLVGIVLYVLSHLTLLYLPVPSLTALILYTVLESCAYGLVMPRKDSIVALCLDEKERARMTSIMTVVVLGVSIPFGYIAGLLSDRNRALPFLLNIGLFVVAFIVVLTARRLSKNANMETE